MAAVLNASDKCDALVNQTTCESSAVIYPKAARVANFIKVQPEFGNATSGRGDGSGAAAAIKRPAAWVLLLSALLSARVSLWLWL